MRYWYVILCAVLLFTGCDERSNTGLSSVPSAPVQYTVYVTQEYPGFVRDNGFYVLPLSPQSVMHMTILVMQVC